MYNIKLFSVTLDHYFSYFMLTVRKNSIG